MAMRWLTREWQSGALPAGERETRWQTYLDHRDSTSIHLPPALHRLAAAGVDGALTLHQAVPEWWVFEPGKSLTLAVITGDDGHDPAAGPQRVVLQYAGNFELVGATPDDVDAWLSVPGAHLLYDEIEVLPGRRFEQRFLLAPGGELTIRFDSVLLISAPTTVAERDALVARRGAAAEPEPEAPAHSHEAPEAAAAPPEHEAPKKPFAPPVPFAKAAPAPVPAPAPAPSPSPSPSIEPVSEPEPAATPTPAPELDAAPETADVADPPEGSPAPVPDPPTSLEAHAGEKRTLRETLLSWLPGVRGSRS